ncbi:MAG: alpha/beta hydrolase [Chloroflexi bacterium]|nr:alpha/beta hydrolase [Chloroflexota bacterium]
MYRLTLIAAIVLSVLMAACAPLDDFEDDAFFDDEFADEEFVDEEGFEDEPEAAGPSAENGSFTETACQIETAGYEATCGFLTVPENRADSANTNRIDLAVVVIRAPFGSPEPDPIVYLSGGPGSSALLDFEGDPEGFVESGYMDNRDLILVDQRGTGFSEPTLNCPEVEEAEEDQFAAFEACRDRLVADGVDLAAYNNDENANDIADLITALGYDQANLYGVSYGTRLALGVMRDHPEVVRSAVLDSVFPHDVDVPLDEAPSLIEALEVMYDLCAADAACNAAYPDLEARMLQTVAQLDAAPGVDPDGFDVDGAALIDATYQALFAGADGVPLVPRMIYDASEGDFNALLSLYEVVGFTRRAYQDGEDRSDSEGMYHSIICQDEFAFVDVNTAEQQNQASLPPELANGAFAGVLDIYDICTIWDVGQAPAIENQPVVSDIPTLILNGSLDPATPASWAERAAQTLSSGYYFEFTTGSHSLTSFDACAIDLMAQFFEDPSSSPDGSCVANAAPLEWVLPGDPLP